MKTTVILGIVGISLIYSFSGKQSDPQWEEKGNGTIGDIKYSILGPEQFRIVNGEGWVLLDGRTLDTNSDLYRLLQSTGHGNVIPDGKLPNGDGVFIRGVDTDEKDSYGDPQKNRTVGSYQEDEVGPHKHPQIIRQAVGHPGNYNVGFGSIKGDPQTAVDSTKENTGVETIPKNICLYTYIKINNITK